MTKHPIDKIFEEKLKDFEQMPRAAVWDKLNAQLDQKTPVSWWKRKVVWWSTGLSVTFLTIGLALWKPQATPPPAQTAAKMVSLQMKLKGIPMSTYLNGKLVTNENTEDNTSTDNTYTNNLALNDESIDQPNALTNTVSKSKSGVDNTTTTNIDKDKVGKVTAPMPNPDKSNVSKTNIEKPVTNNPGVSDKGDVTTQRRANLPEFELIKGAQGLALFTETEELKNVLPKPKAQPKITVTLKLSENMAGSRDQDEGEKGLKKIWKTIKGLGKDNQTKKKTKKKRTGILKFFGDRDD